MRQIAKFTKRQKKRVGKKTKGRKQSENKRENRVKR
jgi:hypothetical protein